MLGFWDTVAPTTTFKPAYNPVMPCNNDYETYCARLHLQNIEQ